MPVVYLHPDQLQPNGWNSNVVSPENEEKLDEAIRRHGFFKPIIARRVLGLDPELQIIGGEHRWQSAQRLGLEEIPVSDLGFIDDEAAKEISLADNARYGTDDSAALAEILQSLGENDIQSFLPYTEADVKSIFSATSISLDDLELDEDFEAKQEAVEPPVAKAPKTHTVMRFKVSLSDAEHITSLITRVQKRQGFSESDQLTNAGDALVHLIYGIKAEVE